MFISRSNASRSFLLLVLICFIAHTHPSTMQECTTAPEPPEPRREHMRMSLVLTVSSRFFFFFRALPGEPPERMSQELTSSFSLRSSASTRFAKLASSCCKRAIVAIASLRRVCALEHSLAVGSAEVVVTASGMVSRSAMATRLSEVLERSIPRKDLPADLLFISFRSCCTRFAARISSSGEGAGSLLGLLPPGVGLVPPCGLALRVLRPLYTTLSPELSSCPLQLLPRPLPFLSALAPPVSGLPSLLPGLPFSPTFNCVSAFALSSMAASSRGRIRLMLSAGTSAGLGEPSPDVASLSCAAAAMLTASVVPAAALVARIATSAPSSDSSAAASTEASDISPSVPMSPEGSAEASALASARRSAAAAQSEPNV
mmetsp:Transcript_9674/g.39397  ORF Transcript_9674/g.39397 Transcript_9674/m.39397 type:complete len:373 (-) Transcript_9674:26-1144(-)